jgi:hypothetical protein
MSDLDNLYSVSFDSIAPGIVNQADKVAPGESIWDSVAKAIPTVFMADTQRRLLNVQIERARAGLPPLDTSQYGVGVNVGLSPSTIQAILLGGAGIALALYLGRRR